MITIRPARPDDEADVAAFTQDTFEWGDYVGSAFARWLEDPGGTVLVAAGDDDRAVGLARASLLSETEVWLQGIRVRPDLRRRGIGDALGQALLVWAHGREARIARLLIEDWNEASQGQAVKLGFRAVTSWAIAERPVGEASPVPRGNGGKRVAAPEQLRRATSAEAEPAYMAWVAGSLCRPARSLFPVRWAWRRLTVDDLTAAAKGDALWEGRPGWAMATREADDFAVAWLQTDQSDAYEMARALVDLAAESDAERLRAFVPRVNWLAASLRRAGCAITPMTVYARSL